MAPGFLVRWIAANGWSEAAGLGTTFVIGRLAAPLFETDDERLHTIVLTALLAVAAGVLLEGWVVGRAQARVVRLRLPRLETRTWTRATMVGAGLAWALGMIPSSVVALMSDTMAASAPASEPGPLVVYPAAAALGAVTGPVLGVAQWTVLRRHVPGAGAWLWANAAAWAVGMPVIFAGMELVPWNRGALPVGMAVYAVCGAAGLTVGAIHGRVLDRLTRAAAR